MNFIIIVFPFIYNFLYLFNRKSNLFKDYKKWIFVISYCIIGIGFYLINENNDETEKSLLTWQFFTPMLFTIYLSTCSVLSKEILNRDFKLFLRYSDEINYQNPKKSKAKLLDKLFSYLAIVLVIVLPLIILIFI